MQLVAGVSTPDLLVKASPSFRRFQDGQTYHGAYGPRLAPQLPALVRRLQKDIHSRQAVLTIWDPLHDLIVEGRKDYPCTVMLQFLVRHGKLQLHTKMRSNDVWLGLTYDAFQFTQLQLTVARALGVEPGPYFHHATSLHMYERDIDASRTLEPSLALPSPLRPQGLPYVDININIALAKQLLAGDPMESCAWYSKTLAPLFKETD